MITSLILYQISPFKNKTEIKKTVKINGADKISIFFESKKKKIDLQILISDYITGGAINHGGVLTDREVANPSI